MLDTNNKPEHGLVQCSIADRACDLCGSIRLCDEWVAEQIGRGGSGVFDFVALSEAKAFTEEENPVWNYYVPKEREDSAWELYFVLLVQWDTKRQLWEREALGKVFRSAFSECDWSEIVLG